MVFSKIKIRPFNLFKKKTEGPLNFLSVEKSAQTNPLKVNGEIRLNFNNLKQ